MEHRLSRWGWAYAWGAIALCSGVGIQPAQAQSTDLLPGNNPVETSTPSALAAGYDFLAKGWIDDAIAAFEAALAATPNALRAKQGLAMAYQKAGRDEEAWNTYQSVLAQAPDDANALRAVGTMGSYRPEWQTTGIAALSQLLQQRPDDELTLRGQRALLLGYQQRFPEAIADYEILLAAPQPEPTILVNAAQIYTYSDRTDVALPLFERYQAQGEALSSAATLAYATALRKQDQPRTAIQILERFKPDDANQAFEQLIGLTLSHQANGDPAAALSALKPTLEPLLPEAEKRRAIANVLTTFDALPPRLLPTLQQLLQEPEPVEFLRFRVAQIEMQQQDWVSARTNLLAYQAATPDLDIGTEFLLAELDRRDGQLEASATRYQTLRDVADAPQQLDALAGIAAIRFEQQRLSEAESLYRQLISQRPSDATTRRTFAELLLAQDKPKEALAQFEAARLALADVPEADVPKAGVPEADVSGASLSDVENPDTDRAIRQRQRSVRRSFLRRRGFQPRWERY